MNRTKYVFAQLISFLDNDKFRKIVDRHQGNRYTKNFTCWNQLLVMMFGQLSARVSLRDLICATTAHRSKSYHLGFGKSVTRSNLAKANQNRNYKIFEEFAYYIVGIARAKRVDHIFKLDGNVYAFDSTTIKLCLDVFWWAKFRKKKGGIKVHTLYDIETQIPTFFHITTASMHDSKAMDKIPYESESYYIFDRAYNKFKSLYKIDQVGAYLVVRSKKNLQFKTLKWKRRMPKNILSDMSISLTGYNSQKQYPDPLRLVKYWDDEQKREFTFLTNATHLKAQQVADLYKNRWQVELFFKWLKQHLKIKKFWGESENAVRIQIYIAMITYCLVAIVQHDMQLKRSTYEVLQILSISLTDTTPLQDLFDNSNFNNVNERSGYSELNLFNF